MKSNTSQLGKDEGILFTYERNKSKNAEPEEEIQLLCLKDRFIELIYKVDSHELLEANEFKHKEAYTDRRKLKQFSLPSAIREIKLEGSLANKDMTWKDEDTGEIPCDIVHKPAKNLLSIEQKRKLRKKGEDEVYEPTQVDLVGRQVLPLSITDFAVINILVFPPINDTEKALEFIAMPIAFYASYIDYRGNTVSMQNIGDYLAEGSGKLINNFSTTGAPVNTMLESLSLFGETLDIENITTKFDSYGNYLGFYHRDMLEQHKILTWDITEIKRADCINDYYRLDTAVHLLIRGLEGLLSLRHQVNFIQHCVSSEYPNLDLTTCSKLPKVLSYCLFNSIVLKHSQVLDTHFYKQVLDCLYNRRIQYLTIVPDNCNSLMEVALSNVSIIIGFNNWESEYSMYSTDSILIAKEIHPVIFSKHLENYADTKRYTDYIRDNNLTEYQTL